MADFGFWNGNVENHAQLHFGFHQHDTKTMVNWGCPDASGLSSNDYPVIKGKNGILNIGPEFGLSIDDPNARGWNSFATFETNSPKYDGRVYFTITFDPTTQYMDTDGHDLRRQTLYVNGNEIDKSWFRGERWESLNGIIDNLDKFIIGPTSMNSDGYWLLSKMKVSVLRLYSRPLNSDEIQKNYEKSVSFHEKLEEGN